MLSGCVNVTDNFLIRTFTNFRSSSNNPVNFNEDTNSSCRGSFCHKSSHTGHFGSKTYCKHSPNNYCAKSLDCERSRKVCVEKEANGKSADVIFDAAWQLNEMPIVPRDSGSFKTRDRKHQLAFSHPLAHLDLSGCCQITDASLL